MTDVLKYRMQPNWQGLSCTIISDLDTVLRQVPSRATLYFSKLISLH